MADLNEYEALNGVVLSEDVKMLMEHFADVWEKCRADDCTACQYRHGKKYYQMLMCMSERNADELIASGIAPVAHGSWKKFQDIIQCTECGFGMFPIKYAFKDGDCVEYNGIPNYCPYCGRKMEANHG